MDDSFAARKDRLRRQLGSAPSRPVRLRKSTSNLFRARNRGDARRLDARGFHHVLDVDPQRGQVDVEGLATYEELVAATLPHHMMPQVVPELKTITIGGALSGGGIESSSFRFGFVHETIDEIEVLLPDGATVVATRDNEHRDLFFGFPNSYGTLGYALRVCARLAPVKPYVQLRHRHFESIADYVAEIDRACRGEADFVDGTVFHENHLVITSGTMVEQAPRTSDYTWMKPYYRSVERETEDVLTIHDYLWRWDADWFWCSRVFGMDHPLLRFLFGKWMLHSRRYSQLMKVDQQWGLSRRLGRDQRVESVIQDVQLPLSQAPVFLDFLLAEIPIRPIWVCPSRSPDRQAHFPLYPTDPDTLYVNFGFWGAVPGSAAEGAANRSIEAMVERLGGKKSLYSSAYYDQDAFDRQYGGESYRALKARYDPKGLLGTLYDKCVLRK